MPDLRPNSQDTSAFYLQKMYQLQADPNASSPSNPSTVASPPAFSPPTYALWVNSLWFLSLVISLTCAMLATSLHQWARRYLRDTQPTRCSPHKRARMRAFFSNGVDKFQVAWAVEALPTLVHLALFIFFAGLLIFLFNVSYTVFEAVVCWVALASVAYACFTLMPIFWHDSPYFGPLTSTAWLLYAAIPYALFKLLTFISFRRRWSFQIWNRFRKLRDGYRGWVFGGRRKAAEETASGRLSEIDCCIVGWTVDALREDDELEKFFDALPGFYTSGVVDHLQEHFPRDVQQKIEVSVGAFLNHTLSFSSVSESVAGRRLFCCLNAADAVGGPCLVGGIIRSMAHWDWHRMQRSVEFGHFLTRWDKSRGGRNALEVRGIISCIVESVQDRDDRWMALVLDHLNVPEYVLADYLAHGDSVLLANLIHFVHDIRRLDHPDWFPFHRLQMLSRVDTLDTLPELQHEFCALWNEIVREIRNGKTKFVWVLMIVRRIYLGLHRGTDAAPTAFSDSTGDFDPIFLRLSSYPLCNVPDHLPDSILHVPDLASGLGDTLKTHAHATIPPTIPRPDTAPITVTPPTGEDVSSSPTFDLDHTISYPAHEASPARVLCPISASFHKSSSTAPIPPSSLTRPGYHRSNTGYW